jgi:hypothetical protein
MSQAERGHFEIPKDMQSIAEASVDRTRRAFEKFISSAQAASDSLSARTATARALVRTSRGCERWSWTTRDLSATAFSYAEKNAQASLDYARALSEALRPHRDDDVRARMCGLAAQANEMGQITGRTAIDAAKPKGYILQNLN